MDVTNDNYQYLGDKVFHLVSLQIRVGLNFISFSKRI